jgi:hypothetical protein
LLAERQVKRILTREPIAKVFRSWFDKLTTNGISIGSDESRIGQGYLTIINGTYYRLLKPEVTGGTCFFVGGDGQPSSGYLRHY